MPAMAPVRHKGPSILYRVRRPEQATLPKAVSPGLKLLFSSFVLMSILGVMRFLQTEWHRHERDRNAWQIERAEMKSRIGKLEGDLRTNKRLRESMDKHIRMLEQALRKKNQDNLSVPKSVEEKPKDNPEGKSSAKLSPSIKRQYLSHGR